MLPYKRLTFGTEKTLHNSAIEYLKEISDYKQSKETVTLKKDTLLFHSSTVDTSLHRVVSTEFKFPLLSKPKLKNMYFAITRNTAIAVLFHGLMNRDDEYVNSLTPRLGFVLEFKIKEPITLLNAELESITKKCEKNDKDQVIGFYTGSSDEGEPQRDFFNGMVELCLKDQIKHLELIKIHLVNMTRRDIKDPPHIISLNYAKLISCIDLKPFPNLYEKHCKNQQHEFDTQEEYFEKYKNILNFDNYVIDTRLANQIPKEPVDSGNYIINEDYINKWFQEATKQSAGNKTQNELIYILGRNRKIIKEGRIKYIRYNNTLIKLTDARKIDKNKS
jgi:hypothetical protein